MAAPVVERSTGDVIPASDHNDVKDYIEDGTYRINSLSYNTQAAGEVISSAGVWTGGIIPVAKGGTGIAYFTPAGPSAARIYTFPDAAATILYSGGALGTPSGGTMTNVGGTAASLTAGSVTGFTPASGSLTLAGADAVTITTTGATNSTLPLGTKTLVATDVATLSSLTSFGTIATGVWEATDVGVAHGGTGKSAWTQYLIPYADTTTSLSQIAIGTDGQVLTSGGAGVAPTFETAAGGGADPAARIEAGCNAIRIGLNGALKAAAGTYTGWGDSFMDTTGRNNSVDTATTTALFSTDMYAATLVDEASGDTTDTNTFTSPTLAFDGSSSTNAYKTSTNGGTYALGKTFASKTFALVNYKLSYQNTDAQSHVLTVKIQTYASSTWSDAYTVYNGELESGTLNWEATQTISATCEGIRAQVYCEGSRDYIFRIYLLQYGDIGISNVVMNVPAGTFGATITKATGVPLIENKETGVAVDFKLTNTLNSDDTGWLTSYGTSVTPTEQTFSAFTSEPDKLTVRLSPTTSGATALYPSINGFWVYTE